VTISFFDLTCLTIFFFEKPIMIFLRLKIIVEPSKCWKINSSLARWEALYHYKFQSSQWKLIKKGPIMVQKSCSLNIEMSLKHCTNQKALLCNKMFPMVWWLVWSSIGFLKQCSLGGSPYTHFLMCTSRALLLPNFFHKMVKGISRPG
jgi:hypothetical protein